MFLFHKKGKQKDTWEKRTMFFLKTWILIWVRDVRTSNYKVENFLRICYLLKYFHT